MCDIFIGLILTSSYLLLQEWRSTRSLLRRRPAAAVAEQLTPTSYIHLDFYSPLFLSSLPQKTLILCLFFFGPQHFGNMYMSRGKSSAVMLTNIWMQVVYSPSRIHLPHHCDFSKRKWENDWKFWWCPNLIVSPENSCTKGSNLVFSGSPSVTFRNL